MQGFSLEAFPGRPLSQSASKLCSVARVDY